MSKKEIDLMRTIVENCTKKGMEAINKGIKMSPIDKLLSYLVEGNNLLLRSDHLKISVEQGHYLVEINSKDGETIVDKKVEGDSLDSIDKELDSIISSYLARVVYKISN